MPVPRRAPPRKLPDVKAEIARATAQLQALARDPDFLAAGSTTEAEHSAVSRRLAALRFELRTPGVRQR